MFVELKMTRGPETINSSGILRAVPIRDGEQTRLYLFAVSQPVDCMEAYDDVKKKLEECK